MRVEAHIHIGRKRKGVKECMSVRDLPSGKVRYASYLLLSKATFSVQPAGLRKFRETGQKNVHAYMRGDMFFAWENTTGLPWREVRYNPAVNDSFVDAEFGFPVHRAEYVLFDGNRVLYYNS